MMSPEQLKTIAEREARATKGPWAHCNGELTAPTMELESMQLLSMFNNIGGLEDSRFCAHARTDIPLLLAEVTRLTHELDLVRRERHGLRNAIEEIVRHYAHPLHDHNWAYYAHLIAKTALNHLSPLGNTKESKQ